MTIKSLLDIGEDKDIALTAPARPSMSYAQLRAHIEAIGGQLAGKGLAAGDRVAIVLPNGPEMASAFLAVASYMSAAPLNPVYKQAEYEFYLEDLRPKLVIVGEGSTNPVIAAAAKLGIEVVEARVAKDALPAALPFLMNRPQPGLPVQKMKRWSCIHPEQPHVQKLYLCCKKISWLLRVILLPAWSWTGADHCLNIMPLFHIHGLIAVLAASMGKGASVCCSAGFNALQFFDMAAQEKISWYSGVPTMHQAILLRAQRNPDAAKSLGLRFIRSSSASLPPAVFDALNAAFGCPVIEAYGMTEAAHQMTSNPLGKGRQKAGFVGIVTNPEVCILDTEGTVQPQGREGEVSIRGENVTPGYENNDAANASSFTNGWFRTGDQGYFDADGYLKITGRLKEIINRGGEKISPLEVDNVLMEHPAIQQVVTFAVEDKMLGEDVAAAVVLAEGASLSEAELKEYANAHLAKFKVPKHIRFLDEIPKGATGKLQRIGLAEKLGL